MNYLQTHMFVKHKQKKRLYDCKICKKIFSKELLRNIHMNTHHKQFKQPILCELCGKLLETKITMKNPRLSRARVLLCHMMWNHQEKKFKCSYCNKKFLFETHFKVN